jgi:hypothetical protein
MKKENPMKTKILVIVGTVLLSIIATDECLAQSRSLEVDIPFTFEVENKTLPAGSYRVESAPTGAGSIEMLCSSKRDVVLPILTITTTSKSGAPASALVFHRFGNRYFLAQIRMGDGHTREVFPSQQEKELARSAQRIEVTLVHQAPAGKQ